MTSEEEDRDKTDFHITQGVSISKLFRKTYKATLLHNSGRLWLRLKANTKGLVQKVATTASNQHQWRPTAAVAATALVWTAAVLTDD